MPFKLKLIEPWNYELFAEEVLYMLRDSPITVSPRINLMSLTKELIVEIL
ncbi:MAG TPA: hypothetical protein VHJ38_01530 [Nitrososphaeraceae archaeon]|nr:hypothetical protein [Nitrososphaeraceae archaeon]